MSEGDQPTPPQRPTDWRVEWAAKPLPVLKPCAHCGSGEIHRHATDPKFIVITHNAGCIFPHLTVFEEDSDKQKQWESRA